MVKFRRLIAALLILVLPIQGYAMAAMGMRAPAAPVAQHAGHHAMDESAAGGHQHMNDPMDDAARDAPQDTNHACDKCAMCALCGGILTPSPFDLALSPALPQDLHGRFVAPAPVYADPPLRVPRPLHA
jgi:hypothetical protein